ncbi:MAG: hypothetical protein ACRCX2_33845 [Paraclostridium sp.]
MWEKIQIDSNLIEANTDKAVLINMPKTSKYKGFSFWHPAKCCRHVGKNEFLLQISFTNEFEFRLKKHGKGKHNFNQVLDEATIDANELKEAFGFGLDEDLLEELSEED